MRTQWGSWEWNCQRVAAPLVLIAETANQYTLKMREIKFKIKKRIIHEQWVVTVWEYGFWYNDIDVMQCEWWMKYVNVKSVHKLLRGYQLFCWGIPKIQSRLDAGPGHRTSVERKKQELRTTLRTEYPRSKPHRRVHLGHTVDKYRERRHSEKNGTNGTAQRKFSIWVVGWELTMRTTLPDKPL